VSYTSMVMSEYIAVLIFVGAVFIILYLALLFTKRERSHTETFYTGIGIIFGALVGMPILDILGLGLTFGMILGALIGAIVGGAFDRYANRSSKKH